MTYVLINRSPANGYDQFNVCHDLYLVEHGTLCWPAGAPTKVVDFLYLSISGSEYYMIHMHREVWMLDQAPMQRQGHVYHAEPCTRRRQWPLGAEQACKEILPLELHMVRQAVVIRAHALHLAAVSNVHATRSSTRRERAVIVVSASSCHSPILFAKTPNT